jgi:polysaccharide pyruvyl transferase WcaK-like protein
VAAGTTPRIAFWGYFGIHNLGNECTLHAMLLGVRRQLPGASLLCIGKGPQDVMERHGIAAIPIAPVNPAGAETGLRRLRRLLDDARQLADWARAIRVMRGVDCLVMTGTGMLHDMRATLFGMPYQMLKWSAAARLGGCEVAFVSVGADGLSAPLQVRFLAWSLRLASYRSFRDRASRERISRVAGTPADDPVYPDLAFSLPEALTGKRPRRAGQTPICVAIGIYAVESGAEGVRSYTEAIGRFVLWLLDNGYGTRIVIGDSDYDQSALAALRAWLAERGALNRVVHQAATSFEMLFDQLAEVDLVVATRFHNVLCALLLEKPVLSVSHKDKNDQLMASMGLSDYCIPLDAVALEPLVARFRKLEREGASLSQQIRERNALFRRQLESQYALVFGKPC